MKILVLAAAVTVFAVPALAQKQECTDENKSAWYQKFLDNRKGDEAAQKVAYDAAKMYLDNCPADPNDAQAKYMKEKFVDPYDKIHANLDVAKQFQKAVNDKNNAEVIRLGPQVVATNQDNAAVVYILMASAGLNDSNLLSQSSDAAKKAIELIDSGKPFQPAYKTKDQALAAMNYIIAKSLAKSDPNAAITYFVKAAKYDSDLKKDPLLYNELAAAYGGGPVAKLANDYQQYIGKPETTESKLVKANLNQAIDRQIDAFARAAALSTNPADKKAIMDVLTDVYKGRNNQSDAGLNDLVATVLSKPIPDVPTPITTLPSESSTPASTGGTNGGANGTGKPAGSNLTTNSTTNGTGKTGTTGTTTAGSAKPAATPTPTNKKPRS